MGWKVSASVRPRSVSTNSSPSTSPARPLSNSPTSRSASALASVACLHARQDQLARRHPACGDAVRQAQKLGQPPVRHRGAALRVEHAQPVRHVVECGVEAPRQQAHVPAGHDGVEQDAAQPVGDELHRGEERRQHEGEDRVVLAANGNERQRHGNAGTDDLSRHQQVAGEIPAGYADHVGDRQREAEDLHERVGRLGECDQAPDAHQRHVRRGADDVAQLPATRFLAARQQWAAPDVSLDVERAHAGDDDDRHRAQVEGLLARLPGRNQGRDRSGERTNEQAARVLEQRIDQREVDLGRQRLCIVAGRH